MTPDKEEVKLFMELKTLEERGVGIWMEGHASDSKKVMETMSVNEDSKGPMGSTPTNVESVGQISAFF